MPSKQRAFSIFVDQHRAAIRESERSSTHWVEVMRRHMLHSVDHVSRVHDAEIAFATIMNDSVKVHITLSDEEYSDLLEWGKRLGIQRKHIAKAALLDLI